ncbi:MAG: poly(3-hydroxybutyrate) depolymerase [Bacteroidia bacterium]|jgi:poly(3-hydroxybutyrate) depolymerase
MKRIFTLCLFAFATGALAQTDCNGTRYIDYNSFPGADVTGAVTFGNNTALGGGNVDLKMDVYEPTGDTETDRPVIVMAFGGSFIGGDRSQVDFLGDIFAKLGYVVVAPDYRVGLFLPSQIATTLAVLRGSHDMKACVRYLKKTVAEDGNPYGIDPDRIIVGGVSAGGISAIHAAYLDLDSEVPAYMANDTAGLGGVEGNSGTPSYSSAPLAVLSFSGTIGDSSWINPGDVPICSIHEENDGTVPYLTQEVSVSGFPTGLTASGSGDLHTRAENVGIDNCLLSYRGVASHVGYLSGTPDQEALDFARDFCASMVCDGSSDCGSVDAGAAGTSVSEVERNSIEAYPNPTADVLNFNIDETATVEIIDVTGKVVLSTVSLNGKNRLDVSGLPTGVYTLRTVGEKISTAHFIKK